MSDKPKEGYEVSRKEKLIFASADIYGGGGGALIGALYFCYLVAMGIGTVWAGAIIAIARVWDAVTDPLMGVIGDNTRSKYGRRRPYILFGGLVIILSLAFLFLPLGNVQAKAVKIIIYLLAYIFYNTVSTIINVSYSSFSTELSRNPRETTQINSMRLLFSMVSSGIAVVGGTFLLDKFFDGTLSINTIYFIVVFGFGALYTIPLILTGFFTKERVILPEKKSAFSVKTFIKPLTVRSFVYLLISYLTAYACMDLLSTNIVYFANYALSGLAGGAIILAIIMVCTALTLPIYYILMSKGYAKPKLFISGIPLYVIGIILLTMLPINNLPTLIVICVIIGLGMGGSQMLPWIIFPDVVDVAELKFGDRPTGNFSGLMTFIKKCSSALAVFLSGLVLNAVGFNEPIADELTGRIDYTDFPQTDRAVWGIRLLIMIAVIFFMGISFISMTRLKITRPLSEKVRELINKRNLGEEYTEEDKEAYENIAKKLF